MTTQTQVRSTEEALKLALEALIGARAFLESDAPVEIWSLNDKAITAIKEALAQPEQNCTRSHPHEEMSKECELRTEIARLTNCLSRVNAQAEHFEREWYLRGDEIERLKAQPEQEPVKYEFQVPDGTWHPFLDKKHYENTIEDGSWPIRALYTTPPQRTAAVGEDTRRAWVGLTDENMTECIVVTCNTDDGTADTRDLIRAVEAKLKEKNNGT